MASSSTMMTEGWGPQVEINTGSDIRALAFSANGEYVVSGDYEKVRVWRVEDGREVATMQTGLVTCLAVSQNNNWIAAGTWADSGLFVWDVKTHEKVWQYNWGFATIFGVNFSPDSTRLIVAVRNHATTVFDVATGKPVLKLKYEDGVHAVKYSPKGGRIATATSKSIRVWDVIDGHLLSKIDVSVAPVYNTGLLWFNEDHLFVVSDNKIKRFDASIGSAVSEWPVPDTRSSSCIALPQHGEFIAYSTNHTISFWDPSTSTQLCLYRKPEGVCSISFSSDARCIVIGGKSGNFIIKDLSTVIVSFTLSRLSPAFQEPDILINDAILNSWMQGQLVNTEEFLTASVTTSQSTSSHEFACRALVRSRLRNWDAAIADAEKSIEIQPSVLGYIAKSIALVGNGERHKAYRACDIALEYLHSTRVKFLLLIKAIIVFMAGEHDDAISRVDDLISMATRVNPLCCVVQAYMHLLVGESHMENCNYEGAIRSFEHAQTRLRKDVGYSFTFISLISGWKFDDIEITVRQKLCEALYAARHTKEAAESLLNTVKNVETEIYASSPAYEWIFGFAQNCLSALDNDINTSALLKLWAELALARRSWKDSLAGAVNFMSPRFVVCWALCEQLEIVDCLTDAMDCLIEMASELASEISTQGEKAELVQYFKPRCSEKLVCFGDVATCARRHDDAIEQYSVALSLDPVDRQAILVKRSTAYAKIGLWTDALKDANEVIRLDASSPWGYERKYVALHGAERHEDVFNVWEMMVSKMSQSSDPDVCARPDLYVKTKTTIRNAVQDSIRESPRVLINTTNGRLYDKAEQATAFELSPMFTDLLLSTTTHIDHLRIEQTVKDYYRYATFSHRWEPNEPLYDKVMRIVVYELDQSLTHDKLKMFCKIVRDAGFDWAWSDTCCINKTDNVVLQEALVAMFKWYEGSSLTVIFLRGVHSSSHRGALINSDWNTRVWTFQEYHASRVVRFYTEDWKPYLNLDIQNHKDSPEIISEIEEASGISARALMALQPGLDYIREKLCLASRRNTTLVEDAAYSLLGIFSISMPIVYGEGNKAIGRLLAQLLASSGNTSILAWSGKSGSFNSFLPDHIAVFQKSQTTHIPTVDGLQLDVIAAGLQVSTTAAIKLYEQLLELPVPSFAGQRMKLPCIVFKLGPLSGPQSGSEQVYRAQANALGAVEIRANTNISRLASLYLIHPWIDFLLDRQPIGNAMETIHEQSKNPDDRFLSVGGLEPPSPSKTTVVSKPSRASRLALRLGLPFTTNAQDSASLKPPSTLSPAEKRTYALRMMARLKQPFGALLVTPDTAGGVAAHRRVATESLITVQVQDVSSAVLSKLVDCVRVLDVL